MGEGGSPGTLAAPADLARRIAGLPADRRALIERHLLAARSATDAAPRARGTNDRPARLSFAQERLWFLDRLDPGNASYNLPLVLPVETAVPDRAVEAAWDALVARHSILRTAIVMVDGTPMQQCAAPPVLRTIAAAPDELGGAIDREIFSPFDLAAGPPVRATLFRTSGGGPAALVVVLHHLLSDGWSNAILQREFDMLLREASGGPAAALPPLALSYADYSEWQRSRLAGPRGAALLAHWRDRLAGAPQLLELPSDASRSVASGAASRIRIVPLDDAPGITAFARAHQATPFMALLAAFFALLHRTTAMPDLLVGTPVANRGRIEFETMVGLFVNTLPLRSTQTSGQCFSAMLEAVRATVLDAHAHQELPFEQMVAQLVGIRDAARPPLVQALFALEPGRLPDPAAGDAAAMVGARAKFDLTLTVLEDGGAMAGRWDYDPAVLDDATVDRLAQAYPVLLAAAIACPETPVEQLPLLSPALRAAFADSASGPVLDCPGAPATLSDWFAATAARSPAAIALVDGAETLLYAELAEQVTAAAATLSARGVVPGSRVGICIPRGRAMVVALLAVLRLGAAYVPLDPAYPDARLAFMAQDAGLALIIADKAEHARLDAALAAAPVPLLASEALGAGEGDALPPPGSGATPCDTAYIIYTSGSTGQPKGVAISHRAIVNQIRWLHDRWPLTDEDRVLQRTSLSFDASVWELFAPLLAGAQLVLAPDARGAFVDLGATIRDQGVTVVQFVPSLLRVLLDVGGLAECAGVRLLFCGGEPLDGTLAARAAAVTGAQIVNLYGPTEAAINALAEAVPPGAPAAMVPIGRPVANMRAYVLDAEGAPVLPGTIGELYLGGAGLADQYIGRPAATAAAFVPDPFGPVPGERLYRTGDRVRQRGDGRFDFVGRADRQVKLRGFRIEPGETEAALRTLPEIADAVVEVREEGLVAWIVPTGDARPAPEAIRAALAGSLPPQQVPTAFVTLRAMPLLPNGKLDRRALTVPAGACTDDLPGGDPPEGRTERMLAAIWQELLARQQVGRDDDFFAIGGHSLLAVQLVSRVKDQTGVELPLRQVFDTPGLAALARQIDAARCPVPRDADAIDELPEAQIDALLACFGSGSTDVPDQRVA